MFLYYNICTAVFLVSIVFKFFEDCSFFVSVVLKYLFLYSNIFHFCTAVLHSNYLLHIYIQIFVTKMALPSTPVNSILNHGEKPERFNGTDFKRWQQKMLFYLTTLNLARFLNEDGPKLDIGETDKEKLAAVDAWNHSDFLCRNYVLNGLENTLYNIYSPLKTAKELWDSLDKKYKIEDVGLKKFIVGKFLDFKMVDSKTVLSQVQELQVVVHDIHAEGMTLSETFQVCVESKFSNPPFHSVDNRLSEPLDLIHTDICDMKSIPSRGGNKYFITFIDDCSRYCYVYLLSSKDEAVNAFKSYKAEVETQLNKKIKIIRSDRGGEYEFPFEEICTEFGIVHQMTAPYTPQSNGVAERKNRSLKETMNALLNSSGLPQNLWGEAVLKANFILNRVPHRKTQQTPYEKWKGRMPNLNYFKVWGCLAKVAVPKPKKVKVGPKTIDCVFIGYAQNSNAYRFLVQKSEIPDIHVNMIIESRALHSLKIYLRIT